ncbi:MAG: hypothetical protein GWO41_11915 [candidate division Zixibacteria bacterium]|nr:hypothetical protein [candidate division Zixibacteria bacterium]NIR64709.1 hypothetical protein [candidate division Zixibacteria bacterium]NIS46546.1 hypothetical protein [candidate division Zixibacteria bacterium]NIT53415.1 hypothetical protein [candidate division Zixibacteria bacterium]NIU14666.1 hypothetical protein [candidate division Zixibacteria bacterium]
MTANGIVMRTKTETVAQTGRATRGVRIIDIQDGDSVAALARISAEDLRRVGAADGDNGEEEVEEVVEEVEVEVEEEEVEEFDDEEAEDEE